MKLAVTILLLACPSYSQRVITTYGGSDAFFTGDGGRALDVSLGQIRGLILDPDGVILSDAENCVIAKVDNGGILRVIAGTGICVYSGDGEPALSASLVRPWGMTRDSSGNIYVGEMSRVRKISPNGSITTVAGGGTNSAGDGLPGTQALLGRIAGMIVDPSGNLYFSDQSSNRVRKLSPNGLLTTVAGTGVAGTAGDGGSAASAQVDGPGPLAMTRDGTLYIGESDNPSKSAALRKITPDGRITTIPGTTGFFPSALVVGSDDTLYMLRDFGQSLYVVPATGGPPQVILSDVTAQGFFTVGTWTLGAMARDGAGNFYVGHSSARLHRVNANKSINTLAGNGQYRYRDGPIVNSLFLNPTALSMLPFGDLYVTANARIRRISRGGTVSTVAGDGVSQANRDEGVPAKSTSIVPSGVAADRMGNVWVSSTTNVRRIFPDGRIFSVTRFVNSLDGEFSGEDGRAANAALRCYPGRCGLYANETGTLWIADRGNHRIRQITPDDNIRTVAGSGYSPPNGPPVPGAFDGDGGPAISARLNKPSAVTVDRLGNIYILDNGNFRIRKVTLDGVITTIAGNGQNASTGDGGLATAASIAVNYPDNCGNCPSSLAVDSSGNLYFSEISRIRMVTPGGIISTVAGTGVIGFSGDGEPADKANIHAVGLAVDEAGNLYFADPSSNRIRVILVARPAVQTSLSSLTFSGASGGAPPASKSFAVVASIPSVSFTASVFTTNGGSWLSIDPGAGRSPRLVEVKANPLNLPPGTYQGSITVTTPDANPSQQTVAVTLTVDAAAPSSLNVDRDSVSFTFPRASRPRPGGLRREDTIQVANAGSGLLDFTVQAVTLSGGNWLSVNPASGKSSPGIPSVVSVSANPEGMAPGAYIGVVVVSSATSGQKKELRVVMSVSDSDRAILLSQSGLSFTAVAGGGLVPPQRFSVVNLGSEGAPWSVSASTLSGGDWLAASPGSGTVEASAVSAGIDVSVNASRLQPGRYYGLVRVESQGAANTPQFITAFLEVLPGDADPGALVRPAELIFTGVAGTVPAASKEIVIYNPVASSRSYRSAVAIDTVDGAAWGIARGPSEAVVEPNAPARIVVQPVWQNLAAGVYHATLSLQFTDGRVIAVPITLVLSPAVLVSSSKSPAAGVGCVPTRLIPAVNSLGQAFSVSAGWPVGLDIEVKDDCGTPLDEGSVVVAFSNGDQPVKMRPVLGGRWHGTWQTGSRPTVQVTVRIDAESPAPSIRGTREVSGDLRSSLEPPVVQESGIVSAAGFVPHTPVAPGSVVSVFGEKLSEGQQRVETEAWAEQLAGAEVFIGGLPMPLSFASERQINAVIPYELEVNTRHQLLVRRGSTISLPAPVNVAASQPAIFTNPETAPQEGLIFVTSGPSSTPARPDSPARAGDTVLLYCLGLGAVAPAVAAGKPLAAGSNVTTKEPAEVVIGGRPAKVLSSGLAPGLVGVYTVTAVVPDGVAPGPSVPVLVRIAGQASPEVTMAVR